VGKISCFLALCVNISATERDTSDAVTATTAFIAPVRSELLCFICDKSRVIPFDDLIKVCCDFYNDDEVIATRLIPA